LRRASDLSGLSARRVVALIALAIALAFLIAALAIISYIHYFAARDQLLPRSEVRECTTQGGNLRRFNLDI
jgi:hypothetical protein